MLLFTSWLLQAITQAFRYAAFYGIGDVQEQEPSNVDPSLPDGGGAGSAIGSLAIPRILGWREDTARLRPLTRQIFWTYAGYIWSFHVCFGLLSLLAPGWQLRSTVEAVAAQQETRARQRVAARITAQA